MERNTKGQFILGHSAPSVEEALKKSRSLSEQWKQRDAYIGDIVNKHPRIYTSWRAFRFTEKGKKAGNVPAWDDFRTFYNDVIDSYSPGLVLRRKWLEKPWGPDNFVWVSSQEAGDIRSMVFLEYGGKSLSLKQWSKEIGVPLSAIKMRYYRHRDTYTIEEILFGKLRKRNDKRPSGVYDSKMTIRAKASKMIASYKVKDKKMGLDVCDIDIEWMINNILLQPCHYCGDTYRIGCDRIDNSKGHTKENVIPCCYECNVARGNSFSFEEMERLGKTIAEIKAERPPRRIDMSRDIINEKSRDVEYRRKRCMHKVRQYSLSGVFLKEYDSINEGAEAVGGSAKQLSNVVRGQSYKGNHKFHGYLWFLSNDNSVENFLKELQEGVLF